MNIAAIRHTARGALKAVLPPAARRLLRRVVPARAEAMPAVHATEGGNAAGGQAPAAAAPVPVDPIRTIDGLQELDQALARAEAAFAVSDDEGRKVLNAFRYVHTEPLPPDPYSDTYREAQMRVYAHVSGRPAYEAKINEHSQMDLEAVKRRPFPYLTLSPETVGSQLMMQGWIIRNLPLPSGSRVVEFGPGWGNLTLHLAQMGYRVTAVEIEPDFGTLIRDRAVRLGVEVRVVEQDMLAFEPDGRYDAAIFFESFHHCVDHIRMLQRLDDIVAPGGSLLFAGEPIAEFPHPWGVRLDGQSAWSMRRFGWLELGFDTSYFLRTLLLHGWLPERHSAPGCGGADVIIARRANGLYEPHRLTLPPDEQRTWSDVGPDHRRAGHRSVLSCSRTAVPASVEVCVSNHGVLPAVVTVRAGDSERTIQLAASVKGERIAVPTAGWAGQVEIGARPAGGSEPGAPEPVVAVHHIRCLTGA